MNLTEVVFGDHLYKIDQPEASWHQPSPNDAVQCAICGETLSFCFASRTDESRAGFATTYVIPTGVRCGCFLADEVPTPPPYRTKLAKQPIPITPIESEDCHQQK